MHTLTKLEAKDITFLAFTTLTLLRESSTTPGVCLVSAENRAILSGCKKSANQIPHIKSEGNEHN